MNLHLKIGAENLNPERVHNSAHILNLKLPETTKSPKSKGDIEGLKMNPAKICIVADIPDEKKGWGKIPFVLAALAMVAVLNLGQLMFLGQSRGNDALALAAQGVVKLETAKDGFFVDTEAQSQQNFEEATALFEQAREKAQFLLNSDDSWIPEPPLVRSLRNLLLTGEAVGELGAHLTAIRTALESKDPKENWADFLNRLSTEHIEPAQALAHEMNAQMSEVDLSKTEYETSVAEVKDKLAQVESLLNFWTTSKEPILQALGDRYPQDYLILLMNNDELRPGGGFIGSVGLLQMDDGEISNLSFQDVYALDNNYHEDIPVPLQEIQGLSEQWRLRDSNTQMNFLASAQQAMDFYEKESGRSVDGVIAINASVAQSILDVMGPQQLPGFAASLNASNVNTVLSGLVEAKVSKGESPKSPLFELLKMLTQKLQNDPKTMLSLGPVLLQQIQDKQIMLFHKDQGVQTLLSSLGWTAETQKFSAIEGDFVVPVITTMSPNKTERYMKTRAVHQSTVQDDGTVLDQLTLERSHTFNSATLIWLKSELRNFGFNAWNSDLEALMGAGENHSGIRIYLPEGVQLIDVSGDLLRDDLALKYDPIQDLSYYNWDQWLKPGESQSFTLTYRLPQRLNSAFSEYGFTWLKQPGAGGVDFEKNLTHNSREILQSNLPSSIEKTAHDFAWKGRLSHDFNLKLLFH